MIKKNKYCNGKLNIIKWHSLTLYKQINRRFNAILANFNAILNTDFGHFDLSIQENCRFDAIFFAKTLYL